MNDLTSAAKLKDQDGHCWKCKPIPRAAIWVLLSVFLVGFVVSIFILVAVHNAAFFLSLLSLSALVAAFLIWNALSWRRNGALLLYLHSFPDSDLRLARDGQLVKITGVVTCGSVSLESSYEKASRCIYTSTILYESGGWGLKPIDANTTCFHWRLAYSERFSTDFYITDSKSGIRALVKAGSDCKVVPLIIESRLVNTTRKCITLSTHLRKWLIDRDLSAEARLLRLEEGYVKEGNSVSVIGMLNRSDDTATIVQPAELISTGCLWRNMLLPVDVDGLILGAQGRLL
ncbi:uncharacterized membrane protein At1g16860-like [Rhododendron vialii]|uniref:uncharacterized membrane protein At1g16860-like n=1 Tax=Rhododendron vialii TaxID=182163 RepID=UPI00266003A1|nr:uncharacterized membrane protein At1g16860-like [Rhododendron vialii]